MKIIVAMDSFKGSFGSLEALECFKSELDDVVGIEIADGGEGFVNSLSSSLNLKKEFLDVVGPSRDVISSFYGYNDDVAVIEVAEACGITKVKALDPFISTSYGVGEQINDAILNGFKTIYIGLGGSASNDCGFGMLQALGIKFFDKDHNLLNYDLENIFKIKYIDDVDFLKKTKDVNLVIASDVTNPLLGEKGATYVFGPQKGVKDLVLFESYLEKFASIINNHRSKQMEYTHGSGAAGGIGYALLSYFNVKIKSGIDLIIELNDFEKLLDSADLFITGEGKFDSQSLYGKGPIELIKLAKSKNIKTLLFCGICENNLVSLDEYGVDVIIPIVDEILLIEDSIDNGLTLLRRSIQRTFKLLNLF